MITYREALDERHKAHGGCPSETDPMPVLCEKHPLSEVRLSYLMGELTATCVKCREVVICVKVAASGSLGTIPSKPTPRIVSFPRGEKRRK